MSMSLFQSINLIVFERLRRFSINILLVAAVTLVCSTLFDYVTCIIWLFVTLSSIMINVSHKIFIYKRMYNIATNDNLAKSNFLNYYPYNKLNSYLHYNSFEAYKLYLTANKDELALLDNITSCITDICAISLLTVVFVQLLAQN